MSQLSFICLILLDSTGFRFAQILHTQKIKDFWQMLREHRVIFHVNQMLRDGRERRKLR